jgi:hypothetical protein
MPTAPYTRKPLGDQWKINVYMMNLLRKRYQSLLSDVVIDRF